MELVGKVSRIASPFEYMVMSLLQRSLTSWRSHNIVKSRWVSTTYTTRSISVDPEEDSEQCEDGDVIVICTIGRDRICLTEDCHQQSSNYTLGVVSSTRTTVITQSLMTELERTSICANVEEMQSAP